MTGKTDDVGFLKRRDLGDGWSELLDGFGKRAALVHTAALDEHCRDGEVRRYRMTSTPLDAVQDTLRDLIERIGPANAKLAEAAGECPDCHGSVLFLEGERDARCLDLQCGGIARR
jgi:hypothetical protein